jgi:hypothetical protein
MLRGAATGNLQFQHFVVHSGPSTSIWNRLCYVQ